MFAFLDGLQNPIPLGTSNLLHETSGYTSHELIIILRKSKCHFGKEDDRLRIVPCRVDELVCCDESSNPEGPFCFFYATVFKKVLLRLPLSIFQKELLTELNVAPAQLHPNSWAFIRGFSILCSQFDISPTVEVFLYFSEAKRLGRQLWIFFNGISGRALLTLFQSSYKNFKGKFLKFRCNKRYLTFMNGFPLYWTEKPRFQGARRLEDLSPLD